MFKINFSKEAKKHLLDLKNNKSRQRQFKAVGKILGYMKVNLRHPSLRTHKFNQMESPCGGEVFESYAQNHTPGAYRIFWVYGPEKKMINILAIIPHP